MITVVQCAKRLPLSRAAGSMLLLAMVLHGGSAFADNFANVRYDAAKDELVLSMRYSGTNAGHNFSFRWGPCQDAGSDGVHAIEAEVLDDQWRDAAQQDFKKTVHLSLADLSCRPANLTLRTAPRFYYSLRIPARASSN